MDNRTRELDVMAKIIPFKSKQQLKMGKALKVMSESESQLDWEEVNWHHVIKRGVEEGTQSLDVTRRHWF